jgi:hypothetical protein
VKVAMIVVRAVTVVRAAMVAGVAMTVARAATTVVTIAARAPSARRLTKPLRKAAACPTS